MKLGVVADIHSNIEALESVLEEIEADEIVCLGDLVGYYLHPNEAVEAVRESCSHAVKGNHDAALTSSSARMHRYARKALKGNRERINGESLKYLEQLPLTTRKEIGGRDVFMVHGSPRNPLGEYLYEEKVTQRLLDNSFQERPDLLLTGHTHVSFQKKVGDTLAVNPGSVGQPRDGDPRASYALIDLEALEPEILRIGYNVEKVIEETRKVLPDRTATRLRNGR